MVVPGEGGVGCQRPQVAITALHRIALRKPHRSHLPHEPRDGVQRQVRHIGAVAARMRIAIPIETRSDEHTSELQSLMRSSYAVFCLKKKTYPHIRLNPTIHNL